jgi:ABC-type dipeptide/oligopeptide/nickel transport system ATPase component
LLITHNLGIVSDIADRVAVMYAGQIMKWLRRATFRSSIASLHSTLIRSVPRLGTEAARLTPIINVPQLGALRPAAIFIPGVQHGPTVHPRNQSY